MRYAKAGLDICKRSRVLRMICSSIGGSVSRSIWWERNVTRSSRCDLIAETPSINSPKRSRFVRLVAATCFPPLSSDVQFLSAFQFNFHCCAQLCLLRPCQIVGLAFSVQREAVASISYLIQALTVSQNGVCRPLALVLWHWRGVPLRVRELPTNRYANSSIQRVCLLWPSGNSVTRTFDWPVHHDSLHFKNWTSLLGV